MEDGGIWSEERKGLAPSTNAFLFPNHWKPSRYRVTGADGSEREKVRGDSVFADGSGVYMSSETELASMPAYIEKAQTVWEVIYCKFFIVQCFQCFVVCLVCNFGFTYGACGQTRVLFCCAGPISILYTPLSPLTHRTHTFPTPRSMFSSRTAALLSNWGTIYPPYNMYMWTWISPNVSSTTCIGSDVPGTAFIVSFCCTLLSGNNSRRAMLGAPLWPPHKVPGKALPQCGNMLGTVQPLDSRVLARGCWRFFPALRCRWLLGRVLINSVRAHARRRRASNRPNSCCDSFFFFSRSPRHAPPPLSPPLSLPLSSRILLP